MKSFVIKKLEGNLELKTFNYDPTGFIYKPRNKRKGSSFVSEIIIVNPEIINSLIADNFKKKYKKIVEYYLQIIQVEDDEASDGDLMLALDEIARLRKILITKYKNFLEQKQEEDFLKRLKVLENEIRIKLVDFKLIKEREMGKINNIEEEKIMSR